MTIKRYYIFIILLINGLSVTIAQDSNSIQLLRSRTQTDHIWVVAHRGDWKYAPENSLQGLRNALFFGADIIETDVRPTKDGHFIVMHDATVDRTTNGSGTISEMSLADIRKLKLKTNWGQSTQFRVPTLDEYINEAKGRAFIYLDKAGIDMPGKEEGSTVRALLNVLRQHNALQEAIFVLDWDYAKARRIFSTALDSVVYCPVIEDRIPNLADYVEEYLRELPFRGRGAGHQRARGGQRILRLQLPEKYRAALRRAHPAY